jgi:predicted N-acetyltransferase YhbS
MTIRECVASDAASIEMLFQEFVGYLRSIGDENVYRFSAEQYLIDGFGAYPAFSGFVAEDASGLIGYVLFSRFYDGDYVRGFYIVDLYVRRHCRRRGVGRNLMDAGQRKMKASCAFHGQFTRTTQRRSDSMNVSALSIMQTRRSCTSTFLCSGFSYDIR